MSEAEVYVVFGAAVRPDGRPSGTLERRTLGAWALSRDVPGRRFLLTGGQGRFGPPEALVMRDLLLERGVPEDEIELEDQARDTLESVVLCTRLLRRRSPLPRVVVVSSRYHLFRCWLLFRLLGVRAGTGRIPGERAALGLRSRLYHGLRECVATPWDALLALLLHRAERVSRRPGA